MASRHEKTYLRDLRPGMTKVRLNSYIDKLEYGNLVLVSVYIIQRALICAGAQFDLPFRSPHAAMFSNVAAKIL